MKSQTKLGRSRNNWTKVSFDLLDIDIAHSNGASKDRDGEKWERQSRDTLSVSMFLYFFQYSKYSQTRLIWL